MDGNRATPDEMNTSPAAISRSGRAIRPPDCLAEKRRCLRSCANHPNLSALTRLVEARAGWLGSMWQLFVSLIVAAILMIGTFLVLFILQTIIYRLRILNTMGRNLYVLSLFVCLAAIFIGPYLFAWLIDNPYERWFISIMSGIAAFGWIGIYLLIWPVSLERSFSVRLLVNMLNEKRALTKGEVETLHTREAIYEMRYREMTEGGLIRIEDDRLVLLPRGLLIVRLYLLLGRSMGYPNGFNN